MTQIVAINSNEALFGFLKMHISAIGRYKSNAGPFTLLSGEEMNARTKKIFTAPKVKPLRIIIMLHRNKSPILNFCAESFYPK